MATPNLGDLMRKAAGAPTDPHPVDDDELDDMVARASRPNLASLMRDAVDRGLITPVPAYTDWSKIRKDVPLAA